MDGVVNGLLSNGLGIVDIDVPNIFTGGATLVPTFHGVVVTDAVGNA